jgi:hypothetical protein
MHHNLHLSAPEPVPLHLLSPYLNAHHRVSPGTSAVIRVSNRGPPAEIFTR